MSTVEHNKRSLMIMQVVGKHLNVCSRREEGNKEWCTFGGALWLVLKWIKEPRAVPHLSIHLWKNTSLGKIILVNGNAML